MKSNCRKLSLTLLALLGLVLSSANAQQPPSTDRLLWLKADTATTLGTNQEVLKWGDQAGGVLNDGTPYGVAVPHLGEIVFTNGTHPAIIFSGGGFLLSNPTDLDVTNLSIYVVASMNADQSSTVMISTYAPVSGWALGIADFTLDRIKWFSASGSFEPIGADMVVDTPAIVTATFLGDTKSLYFNTTALGSLSGQSSPTYATGHQLTVGNLSGGSQPFGGAIAEVLVYSSVSGSQRSDVESYLQRKYFGTGTGPVSITSQPASLTVNAGNSAAFAVAVDGAPPITYQWRTNGVAIPGANNIDYIIPSATPANALSYTVVVSNSAGGAITSSPPAILTVNSDLTPPTVFAAGRDYTSNTTVVVTFSELVDTTTATNASNYKINNGVTVSSAVMDGSTNVLLTTSAITFGPAYSLTVTNVKDLAGNPIAPNTVVPLQVAGPLAVSPPSTNMVLWFKADSGVSVDFDGTTITGWADQATGGNDHSADGIFGLPLLKEAYFTYGGFHQVVRFNGSAGFTLQNDGDAELTEYSIYVIGSVANNNQGGEEFICDWTGLAFGISDTAGGVPKFVTFNGGVNSLEPAAAKLSSGVPAELALTLATNGNKIAYYNGTAVASATGITVTYAGGNLNIGMLYSSGAQNLNGDIAEILMYSKADDTARAQVEDYLGKKYFGGSMDHTPPTVVSAQRDYFQSTTVSVQFSEKLSLVTATNPGNYSLNLGGIVSAASYNTNGTTVVLTTSALSSAVTNILTVNNVQDAAGNSIAASSQVTVGVPTDPIRAEYNLSGTNDLVVLEAEDYNQNNTAGGITWAFTTSPPLLLTNAANTNFSGTGTMNTPDNNVSFSYNPGDIPTGNPRMDYKVNFTVPGTYAVWVRGVGNSDGAGNSDSVNFGLDGAIAYRINGVWAQTNGYFWGNTPTPGGATLTVPTAGNHVFNVWLREDGFAIDKMIITRDFSYIPTGTGPAESPLFGTTITVTHSGTNVVLSWPGSGTLQSSTNVASGYADVASAPSPYTNAPAGTQKYYRVRQ